ncbi:hypothetical protein NB713_003433 [Xanthomonas sacchari]|nr:hypothetical protein [Xanthomonas sacchari]
MCVARQQAAAADQVHHRRQDGVRAQFVADQQAGQVGRCRGAAEAVEQAQAAHAEQMVQHPAGLAAALHARVERGRIEDAVVGVHQPRQQAVRAQQCVQFAGHHRRQRGDAPVLQRHPLAVGAGQADVVDLGRRRFLRKQREQADQLGLLAAHHVRHGVGVAGHAGHEPQRAAGQGRILQWLHRRGQGGGVGRAGRVRQFDPAVAATDHPAQDDVAVPAVDQGGQGRGEAALAGGDALVAAALVENAAVGVEPIAAQAAGPPIDDDHALAMRPSGRPAMPTAATYTPPACGVRASSSSL